MLIATDTLIDWRPAKRINIDESDTLVNWRPAICINIITDTEQYSSAILSGSKLLRPY